MHKYPKDKLNEFLEANDYSTIVDLEDEEPIELDKYAHYQQDFGIFYLEVDKRVAMSDADVIALDRLSDNKLR